MSQPHRWGQLTYTSFDRGGAGGGWQVKDVSGGLTAAEQDFLRSRISTQFDTRQTVPQFPTHEQIEALPRRLVYVPSQNGSAAYWHTVHAGVDGSGRPGNIFAHAVLDRHFSAPTPAFRPIELWRSPDLLTPFGAPQVVATELTTSARPAGGPITKKAAVRFLLDPEHWARLGVLSALLDALHSSLRGGPTVVLGTHDADSAAMWIAAVSFLMSPEASRRMSFSTLERPRTVAAGGLGALHLVAMDLDDLADLERSNSTVVVSEDEVIELGERGRYPHHTSAGSEINPTPWSTLADTVLADPGRVGELLDRLDEVASTVGDIALDPAWPLAMVVALEPELLADGLRESAVVLSEESPPSLRTYSDGFRAASRVVTGQLGDDTQAVRDRVQPRSADKPRSVMADLVESIYLERAVQDRVWLTQREQVWLPDGYQQPAQPHGAVLELVRAQLARLRQAANDRSQYDDATATAHRLTTAVHGLRLSDFVLRAGLATPALKFELTELVSLLVPTVLDWTLGRPCIERVGPIDGELCEICITEINGSSALPVGTLGTTIDPMVLTWLRPGPRRPPSPAQVVTMQDFTVFDAEYAVNVLLGNIQYNPPDYPSWRFVAVWCILGDESPDVYTRAIDKEVLFNDEKSTTQPWTSGEIQKLAHHFPGMVPLSTFIDIFRSQPWDADLDAVTELLRTDPRTQVNSPQARALSLLTSFRKGAAQQWWLEPTSRNTFNGRAVTAAGAADLLVKQFSVLLESTAPTAFSADLRPGLLTAFAMTFLNAQNPAQIQFPRRLLDYVHRSAPEAGTEAAIGYLATCSQRGQTKMSGICMMLVLDRDGQPLRWPAGSPQHLLAALTLGPQQIPFLESVVKQELAAFPAQRLEQLQNRVGRLLEDFSSYAAGQTEKDRSRAKSDLDKVYKEWLREMLGQGSGIMGKARSMFKNERQ